MAPVAGMTGMREAIGETEFEPQQILGYAPVEPDGSFKLLVPADTPLALSILDAKGRALQTHLNWIQVRPGERRTCDGCHSPRRGAALNSGTIVNTHAQRHQDGPVEPAPGGRNDGRTAQASRRARPQSRADRAQLDPAGRHGLQRHLGRHRARPACRRARRSTCATPATPFAADDLATPAPSGGIINYPDHIAPIWARARSAGGVAGAGTCTNCHADPAKLDLRATFGGTGRMVSYEELLLGDPRLDANGQPVTRLEDGVPVIVRGPALVENMAGGADGIARSSRLTEILFGEQLKASAEARSVHPNPPAGAPEPRQPAQRGREAPDHRVDGPGRPVPNDPSQSAERAQRRGAEPHHVRSQRAAGAAEHLRGLPPAGRQRGRGANQRPRSCATASCSPAARRATTT